jgi:secondary thiamine-phosphate synthase enzyme
MYREIVVATARRMELVEVSDRLQALVASSGVSDGLCLVYCPHTTAGVTVNEHADPAVAADLLTLLRRAVPEGVSGLRHAEGNSDSHALASLVGSSVTLTVAGGRLALGRWQGVFFCEFDGPRERRLWVTVLGAGAR